MYVAIYMDNIMIYYVFLIIVAIQGEYNYLFLGDYVDRGLARKNNTTKLPQTKKVKESNEINSEIRKRQSYNIKKYELSKKEKFSEYK